MPDGRRSPFTTSARIAWTGAGLFMLSLLWCGYCYLFGFDRRVATTGAPAAAAWNASLFVAFALHHSVLARPAAKQWLRQRAPPQLERSIYTWIASLLFIAVCSWWQAVPGTFYEIHGWWRAVAYAVQLTGLILTIRAAAVLDVLDLAGVRQVQRAGQDAPAVHVTLETRGLYGFVRHPLYFAWLLMVCGAPHMTATRASFALITTAYLALAIPWEERSLAQTFGREYDAYRAKVRWRMLPGVY